MTKTLSDASSLASLGAAGGTQYPDTYDASVLEAIPWNDKSGGESLVVELECPEFTSLCPKTHQPDFAAMYIHYSPSSSLVESKSLKLYLFSFRRTGVFHEDVVRTIADDLHKLLQPKWLRVHGAFGARGGISINPTAIRGDRHAMALSLCMIPPTRGQR